ncbi:pyridine nucleotide-disulfide oxidoreductase-domain-containing protein [Naematelia encephala]|uniref:Pyridine nucleotide-disulfide oxidoreductase-domain-containing protein n=1 Tax=Naematelia encephala TaxID=71784 RepID=A0A1Y2BLY2_9TREE|nr:pyridine nucleotide-disulfide oxidoreductase-domain-containing protein [Naematelia encephala]
MSNRTIGFTCTHLGSRLRAFSTSSRLSQEQLVILGSGWAGYNIARQIDKKLYDVTVVSPNSYFSFTPFLASAAVGTLEYRCATEPVRGIKHVHFAQGWADSIGNPTPLQGPSKLQTPEEEGEEGNKEDSVQRLYEIEYDKLIIAVGCYSADFGIPGVAKYAHFLKDIRDSRSIRNRILERLEQAVLPNTTTQQRRDLLSFRVVGGGPTGIEFAAELNDFVEEDVYRLYPELKNLVSITVYDVAPGILMSFDDSLRNYAEKHFRREGVKIKPNSRITAVGEDWLELDGKDRVPHGLLVWSTGLASNPLMSKLAGVKRDEKNKSIRVDQHLRVINTSDQPMSDVFAVGDNAMPEEGRLPATAQVASQMAKNLSKKLNAMGRGTDLNKTEAFTWSNRGSMVSVGQHRAMVDRSQDSIQGPKSRLAGISAWIVWRSYYMTLAMGWRNKILIPVHWALTWFFGRDVTRF